MISFLPTPPSFVNASISEALLLDSFSGRSEGPASTTALACSPPRSAGVRRSQSMTIVTVTPGKTFIGSQKKRRRRRGTQMGDGDGPGDGGGQGGNWGGGSGGWEGGEDNTPPNIRSLWIWQLICLCGLYQALQHLLTNRAGVEKVSRQPPTLLAMASS